MEILIALSSHLVWLCLFLWWNTRQSLRHKAETDAYTRHIADLTTHVTRQAVTIDNLTTRLARATDCTHTEENI